MPGSPPKHPDQRARRNATIAMTSLPADGRPGRAPKWPLGADVQIDNAIAFAKVDAKNIEQELESCTVARERTALRRKRDRVLKKQRELEALRTAASRLEKEIWAALWKTPQATQWEKRKWFREVALYARHQAKGEAGSLDDSKEARMREDRLGLNDLAMLRLRWEIADTATAGSRPPSRRSKRNASRYGDLKVVS